MQAIPSSKVTSSDTITATQFLADMRREAHFHRLPTVEDALSKIVEEIERSPAVAQARLLTRVLVALVKQEGAFRQADVTLLSVSALGMVDSLLEAHAAGRVSEKDCSRAADRAVAAQRLTDA